MNNKMQNLEEILKKHITWDCVDEETGHCDSVNVKDILSAMQEAVNTAKKDQIISWEKWKIENGKHPEYRTLDQLLNDYLK